MTWVFVTDCVNARGADINSMNDSARQISYRTLRKHLGEALISLERTLQYDTGTERGGLRMSADWAVSCWKSWYRGKPCYFFRHSRIEYIFLKGG
jgi:hypothetical protein